MSNDMFPNLYSLPYPARVPMATTAGEEVTEAWRVLGRTLVGSAYAPGSRKVRLLVRWRGRGPQSPTWKLAANECRAISGRSAMRRLMLMVC